MLAIESAAHVAERAATSLFRVGLIALLLALGADLAVHVSGWVGAEPPVHLLMLAAMLTAISGVVARGALSMPPRKE